MNAFTDVNVNLVGEAAKLSLGLGETAPASNKPTSPSASTTTSAAANNAAGAEAAGAAKPKKVVSAESGEWSEEQELALVKAMKQFGKELADRWVAHGYSAQTHGAGVLC